MKIFTPEEVKKLKVFWKRLCKLQSDFYSDVAILEDLMQKSLKIKDLEFFMCDNEYVGIGNAERDYKLIQRGELENND